MDTGALLTQLDIVGRDPRLSLQPLSSARPLRSAAEEVATGLGARPKTLPPKFFYDARGSHLFERICATPEYYPSRTEEALLAQHACDVVALTRPELIVELGSGSSRKTRHFFDACEQHGQRARYMPLDVCAEMLVHAAQHLMQRYDWLEIDALVGDYNQGLDHLPPGEGPRLFLFLGGTIGNFTEAEAILFLRDVRQAMRPQDRLLLGADRVKDPRVLHAAYNDAAGLTAEFNLNALRVLNREVDADFDVTQFRHEAFWNAVESQIEMHLRARRPQRVRIGALDRTFAFAGGETIRTEISRKFTPQALGGLLTAAGFRAAQHFQPDNGYYSLVLATPVG